jgi:hypothetical protein
MPYTTENIKYFKIAKRQQESGVRATPSKTKRGGKALNAKSFFTFDLPDLPNQKGRRCQGVFTYEHAIDSITNRVYRGHVSSGVDADECMWTLADDDPVDDEVGNVYWKYFKNAMISFSLTP